MSATPDRRGAGEGTSARLFAVVLGKATARADQHAHPFPTVENAQETQP